MPEVFIGSEELAAGRVTRHELRRWYTQVYRGVYTRRDANSSLRDRAIAAWLASGRKGVVAGVAASALHGAPWVDPDVPIELVGVKIRPQSGLVPRADRIAEDEITRVSGLPVTSRVRTAFDMGRHLERTEALARLDALMWNQTFSRADVLALGDRYPRAPGLRRLLELVPLIDGGAESPRESSLRLWLLDAGFPRPETQIPVHVGQYRCGGVPRYGMARLQGRRRIRRRSPSEEPTAVCQGHRQAAHARSAGLGRHPSRSPRTSRRMSSRESKRP